MELQIPDYMREAKLAYDGERFKVVNLFQIGKTGRKRLREVVIHPGAVIILPLLDDGRVVMIKNFRVSVNKPLWELPAGTLEIGEPPIGCAQRELQEETGFSCKEIKPLMDYYSSPGMCNERMYVFIAKGLTEGEQALEDGEEISIRYFSWEEIDEMISSGEIEDAKTLVTLLYYRRGDRG